MIGVYFVDDHSTMLIVDDDGTFWEATLDSREPWTNQNWADPSTCKLVQDNHPIN